MPKSLLFTLRYLIYSHLFIQIQNDLNAEKNCQPLKITVDSESLWFGLCHLQVAAYMFIRTLRNDVNMAGLNSEFDFTARPQLKSIFSFRL